MKQLLNAISHCHKLGVVHRDLKLENILFESRNNLKLADLGLLSGLNEDGFVEIVGTPYYVPPPFYGESVTGVLFVHCHGRVIYSITGKEKDNQ